MASEGLGAAVPNIMIPLGILRGLLWGGLLLERNMYRGSSVGVVVPAFNEERLIRRVIETMPQYVDRIIIVDDKSSDGTVTEVKSLQNKLKNRLILIQHDRNQGVGGAIITGYKKAIAEGMAVTAVMAGDAQMDPEDLSKVIDPVVEGAADYAKGNRLFTGQAWKMIPKIRYLGNAVLSLFTKVASGYWHVADSQTGYAAISLRALKTLDLDSIYKRYGFPNDMLIHLNAFNFRVVDVPVTPIYGIGEKSGVRLCKVIPAISLLLSKGFIWRLWNKYVIKDFHPLVFFYTMGLVVFSIGSVLGLYLCLYRLLIGHVSATSALFAAFLFISGLQSLFFAMWFDMEYNKDLK
jgi:glycosyltransferase involved in cell wall biosynthesis